MLCIIHPESFFTLMFFWSCLLWWKRKEKCREHYSASFWPSHRFYLVLYYTWPYGLFMVFSNSLENWLGSEQQCHLLITYFYFSRFFAIVFEFGTKNLEKLIFHFLSSLLHYFLYFEWFLWQSFLFLRIVYILRVK